MFTLQSFGKYFSSQYNNIQQPKIDTNDTQKQLNYPTLSKHKVPDRKLRKPQSVD